MDDTSNNILEVRFDADPKRLCDVRAEVRAAGERLGMESADIQHLVIAVNEACMNIMQHAYKGDCSGEIVLEIQNNAGDVEICLTDFADPVDTRLIRPRALSDLRPGGLGTHFMQDIMDECEYGHLDDGCGNTLKMKKKIA